ncbi:hypothetical protein L1987_19583 [Smallanthus sonchifolius]|uniref:Uncharacterized protein n=1 Tax=Smallanthus sonchifolius TaxID=185202 RepID=A0ACB9IP22_9ASTR|nr:hypothetical protein L1987_19583 [Smallanthus sonchifolius]
MAPEYAGDGIFSIKSDVYSFSVLVLEIVSGEKNRGFVHKEHYNNLIGHAWGLHNEGRSLQFVAKCLGESINVSQVLRSIHVVPCGPVLQLRLGPVMASFSFWACGFNSKANSQIASEERQRRRAKGQASPVTKHQSCNPPPSSVALPLPPPPPVRYHHSPGHKENS